MNRLHRCFAGSLLLLALATGSARALGDPDLARLAHEAAGEDAEARAKAVAALREAGPAGMEALRTTNEVLLEKGPPFPATQSQGPWDWLSMSMEEVGRARDAYASGLYWYTDLDQAKAAAKAAGKPILSLRLLGNLDQEESCANSRYFRTVLYANRSVSTYLRDNYILHWKSVRNVPRVTIDFGDGRTIERTLTGNSIHYVLDVDGNVVDALPGLYGPAAFMQELQEDATIAKAPSTARARAEFANAKAGEIAAAWKGDLQELGIEVPSDSRAKQVAKADKVPTAQEAAPLAMSKSMGESRILVEIFPAAAMAKATDTAGWNRIAGLHRTTPELDRDSIRLMCFKSPILRANPVPTTAPMVNTFASSIALDTVRNEYLMHRTLCEWLVEYRGTVNLEKFNDRVYTELFLTPSSDQWLGLLPQDVYTALDGDGVRNQVPVR